MTSKRIFVTGASGCIGHYIVESLIQNTTHELFLLVRQADKLKIDVYARPGVTVLQADVRDVEQYRDLLQTIDCAVVAHTDWGGEHVDEINVVSTSTLINLLDPDRCEQVIYFSTASILSRENQVLQEAEEIGSPYIRSKYRCHEKLSKLAIAPKLTTLYPTLVLGGGERYPYSHLSSGIADVMQWIKLIRFLSADGSFHFIHGYDIAQVVGYLIEHPATERRDLVLGNEALTVNQTIEAASNYFNQRMYFRIPLSLRLADFLIFLFRIQMGEWEYFSLHYRYFTYQNVVCPASFGMTTYCSTLYDVFKLSGLPNGRLQKKRSS
ncbi:NAD-dependent epimerase/dehydratase family protein [Myxacorys almedinensis]|uniref:NAD-dependent epimerase/dehydratase family protein n=1 Tax=Myxacorys almedinensis A TaxID=2690445 RepID=A0A8J8CJD6_9CYAN|nr:NAD(P)-dependent oxidoreductase [Myxacorys almedinensis]NDJ18888.1 NAD-dependent epimerase/dehydratase family protein [Myxacorys almedinensis A]